MSKFPDDSEIIKRMESVTSIFDRSEQISESTDKFNKETKKVDIMMALSH